ncbi:MAG: NTP transferase domain-containing protein [Myxococcales bacterium]|nr:NTP transferase domain-containing protein [Myxococcales bacterium]
MIEHSEPGSPVGVIVAGGLGTRLGSLCHERPKPMLPVGGRPLLRRQIERFSEAGIERVVILAGHLAPVIEQQARAWSDERCRVEVVIEREPLGSGGCLRLVPGPPDRWWSRSATWPSTWTCARS